MKNITPYIDSQAGFVTTWTVVDTSSGDDDEVTCTKAAEAGKRHFITFLSISCDARLHHEGRGVNASLKSGGVTKYELWPRTEVEDTSFPGLAFCGIIPFSLAHLILVTEDSDSGPWFAEFEAPIQMGENEAATFESAMDGSSDQVTFTMGGFTSDTSY